jgi:hypothetical protein
MLKSHPSCQASLNLKEPGPVIPVEQLINHDDRR